MKLTWDDPAARFYAVVDLRTGEELRDVVWADEEAKRYGRHRRNALDKIVTDPITGVVPVLECRAPIALIDTRKSLDGV